MVIVAFLITQQLCSSDRGVCSEPHISWFIMWHSLVLCLVVRKLYQDEMLNVRMDSMSERLTRVKMSLLIFPSRF